MDRLVLRFPFAVQSLNRMLGWSRGSRWQVAKARKTKWEETVDLLIRSQLAQMGLDNATWELPDFRVRLTVHRYSAGELDYDGLVGGCKPLIDVLRRGRFMRDDNPTWCEMHFEQHLAERGAGRTEVELVNLGHPACTQCGRSLPHDCACPKTKRRKGRKSKQLAMAVDVVGSLLDRAFSPKAEQEPQIVERPGTVRLEMPEAPPCPKCWLQHHGPCSICPHSSLVWDADRRGAVCRDCGAIVATQQQIEDRR